MSNTLRNRTDLKIAGVILSGLGLLGLSGCSSEQENTTQPEGSMSAPSTVESEPTTNAEDLTFLDNIDTSTKNAKKVTGITQKEALAIAKDQTTYPALYAKLMATEYGEYDTYTDDGFVDINRIILEKVLDGDSEYTQEYVTKMHITAKELVNALEQMSKQLPNQVKIAKTLKEDYLSLPIATDSNDGILLSTYRQVGELVKEVEDRMVTYYAIQTIIEAAKAGKITLTQTESCDIEAAGLYNAPDDARYKIPKELGFVPILTNTTELMQSPSTPVVETDYRGLKPLVYPLPGINGEELDCENADETVFGYSTVEGTSSIILETNAPGVSESIKVLPALTKELSLSLYPDQPTRQEDTEALLNSPEGTKPWWYNTK